MLFKGSLLKANLLLDVRADYSSTIGYRIQCIIQMIKTLF